MDELINALTKVQTEIQHASKDAINPYFKSEYATLEQVITQVKKPLNDNGIYFQQIAHPSEIGACVETVFYGHGSSLSTGQILIPADKRDAQGFGSALTYAKRYSLSLACGIGHQKDDDANRAMPKKYQLKIGRDIRFSDDSPHKFFRRAKEMLQLPVTDEKKKLFEGSLLSLHAARDEFKEYDRNNCDRMIKHYNEVLNESKR